MPLETITFNLDRIILFLNDREVLGLIISGIVFIGIIVILVLLHHWGAYRPHTAAQLGTDEKIIKIFRKHKFIFWVEAFFMILIGVLPLVLFFFVPDSWFPWLSQFKDFSIVLLFAWAIFIILGIFVIGTNFFLDVWILTNKRLIDVEQKSLFNRDIAEVSLENIQDINVQVPGLLKSILNIGNVYVQSAGYSREFVITDVAHPMKVKNMISEIHMKHLEKAKEVKIVSN
jgi:hypothetical protein